MHALTDIVSKDGIGGLFVGASTTAVRAMALNMGGARARAVCAHWGGQLCVSECVCVCVCVFKCRLGRSIHQRR